MFTSFVLLIDPDSYIPLPDIIFPTTDSVNFNHNFSGYNPNREN